MKRPGKKSILAAIALTLLGYATNSCAPVIAANKPEPLPIERRVVQDPVTENALEQIRDGHYISAIDTLTDRKVWNGQPFEDSYSRYVLLAYAHSKTGNEPESKKAMRRATEIYQKLDVPINFEFGNGLEDEIADLFLDYGYDTVVTDNKSSLYEQAAILKARANNHDWLEDIVDRENPESMTDLAWLYNYVGDAKKAERYIEKARQGFREMITAGTDIGWAENGLAKTFDLEVTWNPSVSDADSAEVHYTNAEDYGHDE